jgi:hypothetical protein
MPSIPAVSWNENLIKITKQFLKKLSLRSTMHQLGMDELLNTKYE